MRPLTDKQQKFVVAYVDTLDPRAAAIAAGYSPRQAQRWGERLLARRQVVEAIARRGRGHSGTKDTTLHDPINRAWITAELTELYQTIKACLRAPGEGGAKAPSGASLQSVIKALELLMQHLEAEGPGGRAEESEGQPDLSKLSRDELRQLEAILARTQAEPGSAGAGAAQPF